MAPFGPWPGVRSGNGAIVKVDSIMTVGDTLLALNNRRLEDGDLVYVGNETFIGQGSIRAYVRVRIGADLTPTEGEVWNSVAMTDPQVQYERLGEASAHYLQQTNWRVTNDDDLGVEIIDNDGTIGHPVSMREVNRRRAGDMQGIGGTVIVEVPDLTSPARSELLAVQLSNWWGTDGNAGPVVLGVEETPPAFTGAITAVTPANHAAGTGLLVAATGLGSAISDVPALMQRQDGGKSAIVQQVIDNDTVRIIEARTSNPIAFDSGTLTDVVVGETWIVANLPTLPVWPFRPGNFLFTSIGQVKLAGFAANFNIAQLGNTDAFIVNCLVDGVDFTGGGDGTDVSVVGFSGNNSFQDGHWNFFSCGVNHGADQAGRFNLVDGQLNVIDSQFDITRCDVLQRNAKLLLNSAGANIAMFDTLDTSLGAIRMDAVSFFDHESSDIWGSGNAARIMNLKAGSLARVVKAGILVHTSADHDFLIEDGTAGDYDRGDISIINPLGGGIIDPAAPSYWGPLKFTGAILTAGGATTSYLADGGAAPAVAVGILQNQPQQKYPTDARIIRTLRATKLSDTAGVNVTVSLVVGATAQPLSITMLHTDPVGTKYADTAHVVAVSANDTIDVLMAAGADGAPGIVSASVMLE